jgi:membrane peptidoglycan carboxypeptidase
LNSGKTAPSKKVKRASAPSDRPPRKPLSCLLNAVIGGLFGVVAAGILALSFIIIQYFVIAANLPSVDDLRSYASQFQTTTIYDRDGSLIYEILDPNAGRRTYTTLDHISPALIAATIATEDKDFYTNPGFDPWGILRAFWQNYTHGEVVSARQPSHSSWRARCCFRPKNAARSPRSAKRARSCWQPRSRAATAKMRFWNSI